MCVDQYLFSHMSFWGPLISTSNHTPLIYRCPIKIGYWMKPTYYLSTIIIKSIDSMYLKDDSYMAPCHLVWHCKDNLVKENIGGHLSLSKKKEKKNEHHRTLVHWCAMSAHHLLPMPEWTWGALIIAMVTWHILPQNHKLLLMSYKCPTTTQKNISLNEWNFL